MFAVLGPPDCGMQHPSFCVICKVSLHTTKPVAVVAYLQQKGLKGSAPVSMGQSLAAARAADSSGDENPDQADLD